MRTKPLKIATLALLALVFAAATFSKVYFVRDDSGGSIFVKGDEAYLFLASGHTGYRWSMISYPFIYLGEYFYVLQSPNNRIVSIMVMRITASGIERHNINFGKEITDAPDSLTPTENGFYAICRGGVFCKLTNSGFQPATEEE